MTERDKCGIHDTQMMLDIMILLLLCLHKYMKPQFSDLEMSLKIPKRITKSCKSTKDRQHNVQRKNGKRAATSIKCCGVNICKNVVLSLCNVYKYIITMFFRFSRTAR